MIGRCLACGAPCDGDLCDVWCESILMHEQDARAEAVAEERKEQGLCERCGGQPCSCGECPECFGAGHCKKG